MHSNKNREQNNVNYIWCICGKKQSAMQTATKNGNRKKMQKQKSDKYWHCQYPMIVVLAMSNESKK